MLRKSFAVVGLAVAAVLSSGAAFSATYNVGTLGEMPYVNDVHVKKGGSFSDTYNFDIAAGVNDAALTSFNIFFASKTKTIFDIPNLSMSIYNGYNMSGPSVPSMATTFSDMLATGSYSAVVTGTPSGNAGGKYSFMAAAVPEAQTWAMIGVGLGLVGLQLRRRDKSAVKLVAA